MNHIEWNQSKWHWSKNKMNFSKVFNWKFKCFATHCWIQEYLCNLNINRHLTSLITHEGRIFAILTRLSSTEQISPLSNRWQISTPDVLRLQSMTMNAMINDNNSKADDGWKIDKYFHRKIILRILKPN